MVATLVLADVVTGRQHRPAAGNLALMRDVLYALQQGFCGCLCTVSTFVVEGRAIRGKRGKWIYILGSVVLGQVLVLAVLGGVGWGKDTHIRARDRIKEAVSLQRNL